MDLDPDKPVVPVIARVLKIIGLLTLAGSITSLTANLINIGMGLTKANPGVVSMNWNQAVGSLAGGGVALVIALLMLGQAKGLEMLSVVSARVKSRFAIEHAVLPVTPVATAPAMKSAPSLTNPPPKDRVITISEETARQQGLAPVPRRHADPI